MKDKVMIRLTRLGMKRSAALLAIMGVLLVPGGTAMARKKKPEPAPVVVPPPPPPVVVIPPMPRAPDQAAPNLTIPATDADGLRHSVNRNISPAQITWNLRSAYNVAALNCRDPKYAEVTVNYRAFLKKHAVGLTAANRKVDAEFKGKYGARFIAPREKYMTEVYNHFAMPPTMTAFCDAALAVSRDAIKIKPVELANFTARSLPSIEVVFDDFFRRYEQYRHDLADWQAKYGSMTAVQDQSAGRIIR